MQEIIRLRDSRWNGRYGYDTYFVSGTREEVEDAYRQRLRPVAQSSPELTILHEVSADTELTDVSGKTVKPQHDGFAIKISRWAV